MSHELTTNEDASDLADCGSVWITWLCSSFWAWFTEPLPFPRDHWHQGDVVVLWNEFDCDGNPALPQSRVGELAGSPWRRRQTVQ